MESYSLDLRDRVVAACDSGEWTREEIAEDFGVSTSWIRRLPQRRREEGDYGPRRGKRGRKPVYSGQALERLGYRRKKRRSGRLSKTGRT